MHISCLSCRFSLKFEKKCFKMKRAGFCLNLHVHLHVDQLCRLSIIDCVTWCGPIEVLVRNKVVGAEKRFAILARLSDCSSHFAALYLHSMASPSQRGKREKKKAAEAPVPVDARQVKSSRRFPELICRVQVSLTVSFAATCAPIPPERPPDWKASPSDLPRVVFDTQFEFRLPGLAEELKVNSACPSICFTLLCRLTLLATGKSSPTLTLASGKSHCPGQSPRICC